MKLCPSILVALAVCSCAAPEKHPLTASSGYESMDHNFIPDRLPLTATDPGLADYALTLPVFETGNENAKTDINSGGERCTQTANSWQMEGEAAQDTITLVRQGGTPYQFVFRLFIGPCWEPLNATYELQQYELARVEGGWLRLGHSASARKQPDDLFKMLYQVHPRNAPVMKTQEQPSSSSASS